MSQTQPLSIHQLEAVYIYKITKFIRWKTGSIRVCFLSKEKTENEVYHALLQFINAKKLNHEITTFLEESIADLSKCNLIYLSKENEKSIQDIFVYLAKHPIATISNIDAFAERGGMFNFVHLEDGKLDLILNLKNAHKSNVSISSELLELIKVIQ